MMATCPICGTRRVIYWPEHWVYRRGETYYCSEDCMIVDQTKDMKLIKMIARVRARNKKGVQNMNGRITAEQKAKAIEMAIRGESPLAYLKQIGMKNPSSTWQYIKSTLKKTNPKKYAEIPEKPAKVETPEAAPAMVKVDGPLRIETKEPAQVEVLTVGTPVPPPFEYKTTGISTEAGDFQYYRKQGFLDWTTLDGTAVSMSVAEWTALMRVFPDVVRVLGVEM